MTKHHIVVIAWVVACWATAVPMLLAADPSPRLLSIAGLLTNMKARHMIAGMQQTERSTNRAWLSDFLRSRRQRLSPAEHGFPVVQRRRSQGLRRDEVAQLAGVSITYYTWIEQGRDINVSSSVLEAIARALRLNKAERVHLFTLVGLETTTGAAREAATHPSIAHLSGRSSPAVALLYDPWFNVRQSTQLATSVFGVEPGRALQSNMLYRLFADPKQRMIWVDWDSEARMAVGMFRQALARQSDASDGFRILDALLEMPDFEHKWNAYDVRANPSPDEFFRAEPWSLRHTDVGVLRVHRLALAIPARSDVTVVLATPADSETSLKFNDLLTLSAPPVRRHLRPA